MMENSRLKEEKFIRDIGKLFRKKNNISFCCFLKIQQNDTAIKEIRNLLLRIKKKKELNIVYLEVLRSFLSIKKKKKIIINQ